MMMHTWMKLLNWSKISNNSIKYVCWYRIWQFLNCFLQNYNSQISSAIENFLIASFKMVTHGSRQSRRDIPLGRNNWVCSSGRMSRSVWSAADSRPCLPYRLAPPASTHASRSSYTLLQFPGRRRRQSPRSWTSEQNQALQEERT